ncbi:MAG: hypothetical protein C0432_00070 [Candidatus Puniceispirillum sp.]|nr:hypothetical protein [Candidatus Pelagibacter sp.]MBA4282679.1 hypothetical protein [Candidatus Puniceispirillum sp.]
MKYIISFLFISIFGLAHSTQNTDPKAISTTKEIAQKVEEGFEKVLDKTDQKSITSSLSSGIPSLESQLSSISKAQMDYITKFNGILDLIDKHDKRVEVYKRLKGTFTKELFSFERLEFLFFLSLKLIVVYLLYYALKVSIIRMITYHMEALVQKRKKNTSNHKLTIQKTIIDVTIGPLIRKIAIWVLRTITVIIVLDILKVNVFPLLFGFSLMCIAIAVASKTMLQDLLHGIITILRGIISVGEVVKIGDTKGKIEELNLRSMVLRLSTGEVEVIPFSTITKIVNYSRDLRIFKSEVLIGFKQDISLVEKCFKDALTKLRSTTYYEKRVDPECNFLGISEFNEHGYRVIATIKYIPDPTDHTGVKFNEFVFKEMLLNNIEFPEVLET